jgi:DNA-binding LytR/AlgR family response regulator
VPVDEVVAVHANAHYTYVFDGKAKFFCPLAIGVVESRLDTGRFIRVHRSHIVALDRIVGLKRTGDTGVIELAAGEPYTVPVSRGRLPWLKSRLAVTAGDLGGDRGEAVRRPELAVAGDLGQHA